MNILVLNAGSSSLKFQIINMMTEQPVVAGKVDGIGLDTKVSIQGATVRKRIKNHEEALEYVLAHIDTTKIHAIGHRVVHGGEKFTKPTKITASVLQKIEKLSSLAPLHNPANLAGIKACQKLLPNIVQVAVFDTSFHQTMPDYAYHYAIPFKYYNKYGIRRYGFHGTSHHYALIEVQHLLNKKSVNMISCHLGNGSSIAAIKDSKSIDTSMGFTPLEGLIMGTRSGDVDPGVITFLQEKEKMTASQVNDLLNKKSGFVGIDGFSDMRTIRKRSLEGDEHAKLAISMLAYDIVKYIGSYIAVIGNLDALVFTGGIGEQAYYVREQVCEYLNHLGIVLDKKLNKANEQLISAKKSKVKVFVIPANEELMIAQVTKDFLL